MLGPPVKSSISLEIELKPRLSFPSSHSVLNNTNNKAHLVSTSMDIPSRVVFGKINTLIYNCGNYYSSAQNTWH